MGEERPGHTLSATALVHEAYLRLIGDQHFNGEAHIFAAAAEAMRRVLVSHARDRARLKLDGGRVRLELLDQADSLAEDPNLILTHRGGARASARSTGDAPSKRPGDRRALGSILKIHRARSGYTGTPFLKQSLCQTSAQGRDEAGRTRIPESYLLSMPPPPRTAFFCGGSASAACIRAAGRAQGRAPGPGDPTGGARPMRATCPLESGSTKSGRTGSRSRCPAGDDGRDCAAYTRRTSPRGCYPPAVGSATVLRAPRQDGSAALAEMAGPAR
jgi:hypothetical protein